MSRYMFWMAFANWPRLNTVNWVNYQLDQILGSFTNLADLLICRKTAQNC